MGMVAKILRDVVLSIAVFQIPAIINVRSLMRAFICFEPCEKSGQALQCASCAMAYVRADVRDVA